MTGIAQSPARPYVSERTPHLFVVTLVGAALVLSTIVRLLGADPVPVHPLSGAPVDGAVEPTLSLPAEPAATIQAGAGPTMLAGVGDFEPVIVGPLPVPAGGMLMVHLSLPTAETTAVTVKASPMRLDGALRDGAARTYSIVPSATGEAVVEAPVAELIGDAGGIHHVLVSWEGQVLSEEYLALGADQPTGVAVFDEPRAVRIAAGRHVAVRFDARGTPDAERAGRLRGIRTFPAIAYARFGDTAHVLIAEGRWAQYWMPIGTDTTLR